MDRNLTGGVSGKKARPVTPKGAKGYESSSGSSGEDYGQTSEEFSADISVHQSNPSHKYHDLQVFDHPMCLIRLDEKNNLQVEESVVADFEKIDLPMVIIGIAGTYRTGKSYLLNLIADETKNFKVGSSTTPTTKGIWVRCKMHPKKNDAVLVLLDTEGFGDVEKDGGDVRDLKIFTLVVLLCNALIYNMEGVLDQNALNNLEYSHSSIPHLYRWKLHMYRFHHK